MSADRGRHLEPADGRGGAHGDRARAAQALRDAGHDAEIVVTPQNRFGRQASAYLATWLTDVTSGEGAPIDQVISLRYPSYAVRHPQSRLLAEPHDARVLRPVGHGSAAR